MSDAVIITLGYIVVIGFFVVITLYVYISSGGFGLFGEDEVDVIPFPDAKLSKGQRREAIKKRAKDRRWNKRFATGSRVGSKLGKSTGNSLGSISAAKSFKSSSGRISRSIGAKRSKH